MSFKNPLLSAALLFTLVSCGTSSPSSDTHEQGPADVESGFFALSTEVQEEIVGTQIMSRAEIRKELMAKADTDGDGSLSEDEKAQLRAQWQELKEQMKAELKAKLDKDEDGEVSRDELKEGLDNLGQKIKAAIASKHEEIRAAQDAAKDKIKEACADDRGSDECRSTAQAEKDKLHETIKNALEELQKELEELKGILMEVETRNATI